MNKEGIRLYLIGIICIIITLNIPEVASPLQDKLKQYQPQVTATIKASFDNISAAIVPLVGKIGGMPTIFVNGKAIDIDTSTDFSLSHGQSLSVDQIEQILTKAGSPAVGTGQYWLKYGVENDIDAAYGLAIFYQESGLGTNDAWYSPGYNTGNIICAGYWQCHGRFRDYSKDANPWASSIVDVFKLLRSYRDGGIKTYDEAIMTWAPPSENNTTGYIENTKSLINAWRNTNKIIIGNGQLPFNNVEALSAPITEDTGNDFGFNVRAALDANSGALRNITIKNGERWSFNAAIGSPIMPMRTVSGIPGGGWCDLACRYVQVFKGLGLHISHTTDMDANDIVFLQHGGIALYNCTVEESPYIWSAGNMGFDNSMQDLIVNNRTGKTIRIAVIDNEDGTATVIGKLE